MTIADLIIYSRGAKGKPATWNCGKAVIKAPVLNKIVSVVQKAGSDMGSEGKEKLFTTLLTLEGKVGEEFLAVLIQEKVPYLDVVKHVAEYEPQRGRVASIGNKKLVKNLARTLAIKFPYATNKQDVFVELLKFLEQTNNQDAIYAQFKKLADENGCDKNTGMIILRKMTPEGKEKAKEQGKRMGEARAKEKSHVTSNSE